MVAMSLRPLLAAATAAVVLGLSLSCTLDDEAADASPTVPPATTTADEGWRERCNLPDDYEVLSVPPDPCLLADPEFGEAFVAANEAANRAKGPCHTTSYTILNEDELDRIYHDGETLSVMLEYDAPGCVDAGLTFGGYHVNGSPWAMHYCVATGCANGGISSNIFAARVQLPAPRGVLRFVAEPGTFPPVDLATPPNLEGFRPCAIVVGFSDGHSEGSNTSDQYNLNFEACATR
jgi:hypothetical protein